MSRIHNIKTEADVHQFLENNGFKRTDMLYYAIGGRAWDGYSLNFIDEAWELAYTATGTHYDVIARITSEKEAYLLLIAEVMVALGKWE